MNRERGLSINLQDYKEIVSAGGSSCGVQGGHGLRALAAPLTITETGTPTEPSRFAGADYEAETPTEVTYKFNSWRLGYRYTFGGGGEGWTWRLGFTAKIRDAKIALKQGETSSEKTDVGFVTLLHVSSDWRFVGRWFLLLDIEALAGGPGIAEDVSLKFSREISPSWSLAAGYRMVEGGADVEEVYNFAWLHFGVVSATWRF